MRDHGHDHTFVVEDEIDLLLSRANPNPARVECLAREVLPELARRQRSIDDPAWLHVAKCSECFVEIRALQQSAKMRNRRAARIGPWMMIAATIILTTGAGIWLVGRSGENRIEQQGTSTPVAAVATTSIEIDLRDRAIERGDQNTPTAPPLLLSRGRVSVRFQLPVGSEPGPYELELVDASRQRRTSASGTATLLALVTTLQIELNLSQLRPGPYRLALRHQKDEWRFFPATLQ